LIPIAGFSTADRRRLAHEALHRLEKLVKVAVAVKVDLKSIEARFLAVF
jgi:hypothetical protein